MGTEISHKELYDYFKGNGTLTEDMYNVLADKYVILFERWIDLHDSLSNDQNNIAT